LSPSLSSRRERFTGQTSKLVRRDTGRWPGLFLPPESATAASGALSETVRLWLSSSAGWRNHLGTNHQSASLGGVAKRFDYFSEFSRLVTDNDLPNNQYRQYTRSLDWPSADCPQR